MVDLHRIEGELEEWQLDIELYQVEGELKVDFHQQEVELENDVHPMKGEHEVGLNQMEGEIPVDLNQLIVNLLIGYIQQIEMPHYHHLMELELLVQLNLLRQVD